MRRKLHFGGAARLHRAATRSTQMTMNFKRLMAAAAVAALFGTPALAASHAQRHERVPQAPYAASHDTVTAPDGRVIGADPDPAIRFELNRAANHYTGEADCARDGRPRQ